MCGCLLSTPYWGPGSKLRHVPWLGIKLATLHFTVWRSIHWATPARAVGLTWSGQLSWVHTPLRLHLLLWGHRLYYSHRIPGVPMTVSERIQMGVYVVSTFPCQVSILQRCPLFVTCLLIFVTRCFCRAEVLNFDEVQFTDFFLLWIMLWVSCIRTLHQALDAKDFLYIFF